MKIEDYIRHIPDFPKPGIDFRDITPLLADYAATEEALNRLVGMLKGAHIDKVVAIESRGFFFGFLLANRLKVGFVPIRKPGKLPFETFKEPYALEYGLDALEIHQDAIKKGEQILLHDDVLATGGTARAAAKLVEKLGGKIVQLNFLLEIESLQARNKLTNYKVESLLKF